MDCGISAIPGLVDALASGKTGPSPLLELSTTEKIERSTLSREAADLRDLDAAEEGDLSSENDCVGICERSELRRALSVIVKVCAMVALVEFQDTVAVATTVLRVGDDSLCETTGFEG